MTSNMLDDSTPAIRVAVDTLRQLLVRMLTRKGMFAAEADVTAARMIETDLHGLTSCGVGTIPHLIAAMDLGDIDPRAQILTVQETPAIAVLDGGRGVGHVAATKAMRLAIDKARAVGTGTVVVRNGRPLGAPPAYVRLALEAGLIGVCVTSVGGAVLRMEGSSAAGSSNPRLAWGTPPRNGPPLIIEGFVAAAGADAAAGSTLGPFGFGLALQCSILTNLLAGGRMPLHKTRPADALSAEHLLAAIDIAQFTDLERFEKELATTFGELRTSSTAALPGQQEWEQAEQAQRDGMLFSPATVAALEAQAAAMKIPVPWRT